MKRRVQAFVIVTIAVFVTGGIAVNRYLSAHGKESAPPATTPVQNAVVPPSPESSAGRAPLASPSASPRPKTTTHRPTARPTRKRIARKSAAPKTSAPAPVSGAAAAEAAVVRLTNAQRARHGCAPLRVVPALTTAARRHSADMRDRHYFDHDSLDGTSPWDRIKAAGYAWPGAENIAKGQPTAQAVMDAWMNSPGHRANILNCDLKAIGVGVAYGSGGPWWTQDFGFR